MTTDDKKQAKPAPAGKKSKKSQKMALGEFLGPQAKPGATSWADDGEDEFMKAPDVTSRDVQDWRGGGRPEGEQRPFASQAPKTLPDRPPYTLYVGNLLFSTTEDDVAEFFKNTESVRLVIDKATGEPKGYGYVTFPTREDLANALKLDNQLLGNRAIRLDVAQEKGGKGKSGGGFGEGGGGFGSFPGGRDFMGTGQVERPEAGQKAEGGKGGRGTRNFTGQGASWDGGRDAMGSGVVEDRRGAPRSGGGPVTFSRDTMGSEQASGERPAGGGFGGERPAGGGRGGERRGFGGDIDGWSAGREAMGTGVVEERKPPAPVREAMSFSRDTMAQEQPTWEREGGDAPPARPSQSYMKFGTSDAVPSREGFGAEGVPERPERPERPAAWRPSGKGAAGRGLGNADWRNAPSASDNAEAKDSPAKEADEKPRPYQPKNRQSNQELEAKKEKPPPKVPLTQEELFALQMAKNQKREQLQKNVKEKTAEKANANPWEALGRTKKKNKKGKKSDSEEDED